MKAGAYLDGGRKLKARFRLEGFVFDEFVLDAILGHGYRPLVIYSEIMWDFPPPIDFAVIENARPDQGCFGMSLSMVQRILKKHGYTLVEAAHANVMAVQDRDAHLFVDSAPCTQTFA